MYQNSNPIKTVMNETNLHVVGLLTTETNGFYRYNLFDNLEKNQSSNKKVFTISGSRVAFKYHLFKTWHSEV